MPVAAALTGDVIRSGPGGETMGTLTGGSAVDRDASGVSDVELVIWTVALVALVLDTALTLYGLSIGLVERNPVVRAGLDAHGPVVLLVAKVAAVAVALAFRVSWPRLGLLAPLSLAVPWCLAVGINVAVIASA